jgi:hypothetical protein
LATSDLLATLNEPAKTIAQAILNAHQQAYLTSARRDLQAQATAMAENVAQNPDWINQTYVASPVRDACAALNPATADSIMAVLETFVDAELRHLSWHLSGDAFDVGPIGDPSIIATAKRLVESHIEAGGNVSSKVLTLEGGLPRIHVQVA